MTAKKPDLQKHIVPMFTLGIIEILYVVFGADTRNILTASMLQAAEGSVQLVITRIFLLILNASGIYLIVSMGCFRRDDIGASDIVRSTALSLAVRLMCDLITLLPVPPAYTFSLQVTVDVLYLVCIFALCSRSLRPKNSPLQWSTGSKILAAAVPLVLICFLVYNTSCYHQSEALLNHFTEKYVSEIPNAFYSTAAFKESARASVCRWLVSVILYLFCSVSADSPRTHGRKKSAGTAVAVVRCHLLVLLSVFSYITKAWLFPSGIISRISVNKSNSFTHSEEKRFHADHTELCVYKVSPDNNESCVYSDYRIILSYGNENIAKFGKDIANAKDTLTEIDDNLAICGTQALMYSENGAPIVIMTADIRSMSERGTLTDTLKQLITLGYFDFLEDSYDYLYQYAPDFLEASLQQYASGEYNRALNENIREEYIVQFAESALQHDFS